MDDLEIQLDMMAQRIESFYTFHHRTPLVVWGGSATPALVRFQATTAPHVRVRQVADLADELALSLGVPDVRIFRQAGAIMIEVPREGAATVSLPVLLRQAGRLPPFTALLGMDGDGLPLLLQLPSPDVVHVLVAGTTGAGKTQLLKTMALSLIAGNRPNALSLVLVDPKGGRNLEALAVAPHVLGGRAVGDAQEGIQALTWIVRLMEMRDKERVSRPLLVVVIDELADLLQAGGRDMEAVVTRLSQRGREAGIHLIAGTQKPAATLVSGVIKANFPVRLVGAVVSPEDAKVATGQAGTGAEKLRGRGDFLCVTRGEVTRFQAPLVTAADVRRLV